MDDGDEITLRGMRFHTLIGVLPHEREHPQPVEVDLTVWVDRGEGVLDYRRLYAEVRGAMESRAQSYLEDLAEAIVQRILEEPRVRRLRVAIRKLHVAIGGPLEYAEVALERERDA
jgi:dihydroneopterin aldolase